MSAKTPEQWGEWLEERIAYVPPEGHGAFLRTYGAQIARKAVHDALAVAAAGAAPQPPAEPAAPTPYLPPARYEELVTRKNSLLELCRRAKRGDFDIALLDEADTRHLWAVVADLEIELTKHALSVCSESYAVNLLSAATCYAEAGDVERASNALGKCPASIKRDPDLLSFFQRKGITP